VSAIRAVSWDVDGTLYSLDGLRFALVRVALGDLLRGRVGTLREVRRIGAHYAAIERARRAGEPFRSPADRDEVLRLESDIFPRALRRIGPQPGLLAALDAIDARGLPQVVVSDYDCAHKIAALGLDGRFARTHSGERIGALKPDPALFRAAADALGIPPDALLHVGDRDARDGAGARAAGCRVAILGRDIRRLDDLPGFLVA
jgi:HAD superfamily hydrolase (TIGR01509 family)